MKKVTIIDYGAGNIHSVFSAFSKVSQYNIEVVSSSAKLTATDYLILPGVGAFDKPMEFFALNPEFKVYILAHIKSGKPFLGVCVGMQILGDIGHENKLTSGLGLIAGEVKKFSANLPIKVPHIGWNNLLVKQDVLNGFNYKKFHQKDFYFVHSYYFACQNKINVIAECDYGNKFPAILVAENIIATQFHPEKSGINGLSFLTEFLNL